MAHTSKIQTLSSAQVTDSTLDNICFSANRWLSQVALTAITTFCVSISTVAWADTQSFDLSGFDDVTVAQGIQMQITKGEAFEVIAESDDPEQLERLELDIRRGILRAQMDYGLFPFNWEEKETVTIRVTMPSLNHAEAATGAKIMADMMGGSNTELSATTGALLQINVIDGGSMSVVVSNGANIKIADGTCTSVSAKASGGSILDMEKVACADVEIDASSGSNASVNADKSINADASSGGKIRVYGAHEKVEVDTSSGGEIKFP